MRTTRIVARSVVGVFVGLAFGTGAVDGNTADPATDEVASQVSRFIWETRSENGMMVEKAAALRIEAVGARCRVNRSYVKSSQGLKGILTEESIIGLGFLGEGSSYRGVLPEASFLEIAIRAPLDLSAYTVTSVTPQAFEEAVNSLSEEEIEEAAAGQTVSIRTGAGDLGELNGVIDDAQLPARVVERLREDSPGTVGQLLRPPQGVHDLASLLSIVWAQRTGVLLFSKENLFIEVLQEVYPDTFEEEHLAKPKLWLRREKIGDASGATDVVRRWAGEFGVTDPLQDTCLRGRLEADPD